MPCVSRQVSSVGDFWPFVCDVHKDKKTRGVRARYDAKGGSHEIWHALMLVQQTDLITSIQTMCTQLLAALPSRQPSSSRPVLHRPRTSRVVPCTQDESSRTPHKRQGDTTFIKPTMLRMEKGGGDCKGVACPLAARSVAHDCHLGRCGTEFRAVRPVGRVLHQHRVCTVATDSYHAN